MSSTILRWIRKICSISIGMKNCYDVDNSYSSDFILFYCIVLIVREWLWDNVLLIGKYLGNISELLILNTELEGNVFLKSNSRICWMQCVCGVIKRWKYLSNVAKQKRYQNIASKFSNLEVTKEFLISSIRHCYRASGKVPINYSVGSCSLVFFNIYACRWQAHLHFHHFLTRKKL